MATLIQAMQAYGPKLDTNQTIQLNEIAAWMAMRTGVNKSEAMMLLQELNEAILYFNSQGTPIKLPGIGTFSPSIDREGKLKVNLRADTSLSKGLNAPDAYTGKILNRATINLSNEEFKAMWDADHPDDLLELNGASGS